METLLSAFYVLLFAAVIFAVEAAWLWWQARHGGSARRIARRLQLMAGKGEGGERISILKQRRYAASPLLERWLRRVPQLANLDRLLLQSGRNWQVGGFLGAWSAFSLAACLLLSMLRLPVLPFLLGMGLALGAPLMLLFRARAARLKHILEQLPDSFADFLARALRAGPLLRQRAADGRPRTARAHRRRIPRLLRGNQLRRADERGAA
jgi:tight adherence protein B